MTRAASRHRPINTVAGSGPVWNWEWATRAAFVLVLAVTIARLTTIDVLRDTGSPVPGGDAVSHGPGAGTGLAFDLIAAVPALLVLARRAVDRGYRLVPRRSHGLLLALVVWMAASVFWSADRFAAVVSAAHFAGGACLLWAASQLVRSWDQLRVVAAVSLGLLLALVIHTANYRFVDMARTRQYWAENKDKFLKEHGWEPGSFAAVQFEHKLVSGEQSAFFNSANTLASVGVLLTFAAAGLGLQRLAAGDDRRWLGLTAVAAAAGVWVLFVARSKTSIATPVVGVAALLVWWRFGDALRRHAAAAYAAGVGAVVLVGFAVVAQGLAHHSLFRGHFSNSLDFRWKYWTASAGVFREHPLLGVGWGNFGESYLAHRLPEAAEEIKDPHNFLVRFAVELGTVGLLLSMGWLLLLAWEITRPTPTEPVAGPRVDLSVVGWAACLGVGMSAIAKADLSGGLIDFVVLQLEPVLMVLAIVLAGIAGAMRAKDDRFADGRPGPWVSATVVVGLGLFLLHNVIDFAWFESGAAFAFMTLAGAAVGMAPARTAPAPAGRAWAIGGLAVAGVAWAAVALAIALPIGLAGAGATAADDVIRAAPADQRAAWPAAYRRAADGYASAADLVPYDADLWTRAARAAVGGGDFGRAQSLVNTALGTDPKRIDAHLVDANLRLAAHDLAGVRSAFDAALALDPNDVPNRLAYAEALDRLGDRAGAAAQYRLALAANDRLDPAEPRRLSAARAADIAAKSAGR